MNYHKIPKMMMTVDYGYHFFPGNQVDDWPSNILYWPSNMTVDHHHWSMLMVDHHLWWSMTLTAIDHSPPWSRSLWRIVFGGRPWNEMVNHQLKYHLKPSSWWLSMVTISPGWPWIAWSKWVDNFLTNRNVQILEKMLTFQKNLWPTAWPFRIPSSSGMYPDFVS